MKTPNEIIEKIIEIAENRENISNQINNEKAKSNIDKDFIENLKSDRLEFTHQLNILTWLFENE